MSDCKPEMFSSRMCERGTKGCDVRHGKSELARPHGSAYGVQRISKFLRVASDPSNPSERGVVSNDNKLIAILGYYKPWREWVLYPQPNTVWSADCLAAINDHLAVLGSRPNSERSDGAQKNSL